MQYPSLILLTLLECRRQIRIDRRRSTIWGLNTLEAENFMRLDFRTLILISHLALPPLFVAIKAPSLRDARRQPEALRYVWAHFMHRHRDEPFLFKEVNDQSSTITIDSETIDYKLRFNIRFANATWLKRLPVQMRDFLKPTFYQRTTTPSPPHDTLIEDRHFVEMLKSDLPHSVLGNLFHLPVANIIFLRNLLVKPQRYRLDRGAQIREISRYRKDRLRLFWAYEWFRTIKRVECDPTKAFWTTVQRMQTPGIFEANTNERIHFTMNFYGLLLSMGEIQAKDTSYSMKLPDTVFADLPDPFATDAFFKNLPPFVDIPYAGSFYRRVINQINQAIVENDLSKTRLYRLLKENTSC